MPEYPIVKINMGDCGENWNTPLKMLNFTPFKIFLTHNSQLNPVQMSPWKEIRDATEEANMCYSKDFYLDIMNGTEDCLVLNVYTPQLLNEDENLPLKPVMVWIHVGSLIAGLSKRSNFGPEFLIAKDVILVTINYRLGALGFLKINDPILGVTGNAALEDQVMALKWVQENIKIFGGNSNNVTLFGHSAGAACVCLQIVSPMAKGLFHKAIMQSGIATCPWVQGSENAAYELLKQLGKSAANDTEVLNALQSASKKEILQAQKKLGEVSRITEGA